MNLKSFFILLVTAQAAQAANVVCHQTGVRNPPQVISYSYSDAKSGRLNSDVTIKGTVYSSGQVAQYKSGSDELYLLIDDETTATTTVFEFKTAKPNKKTFAGTLLTYGGRTPQKTTLSCRVIN